MPTPAPRTLEYERPWLADYQRAAIFCPERYALIEASTKAGKTAGCLVWLFEQSSVYGESGRSFWWVAPVYPQAEIAYRRMKRAIPRWLYRSNDTERRLELPNGALIWFKSGEKPDNLYGEDVYAAVVDEASRIREESWHALRSTLTATKGPVRIIGNVKGRGNWFYHMARKAQRGAAGMHYAKITAADAVAAGILDAQEIEDAKATLPESVFNELYLAEPGDLSGLVYRSFGVENYAPELCDDGSPLLIGMDFNVNPMTCVIGKRAVDQLHIFDEISVPDSNTEEMAREIRARYPEPRSISVYPDPSGNSRKTSAPAGQTDFAILRSFGMRVVAPKSAPPVVDRINEVNALAKTTDGKRRLFVNPSKCPRITESLESLPYKKDTSQPNESAKASDGTQLIHITDALGYLVHMEFPIVKRGGMVHVAPEDRAELDRVLAEMRRTA
jgi:hypothetical protein